MGGAGVSVGGLGAASGPASGPASPAGAPCAADVAEAARRFEGVILSLLLKQGLGGEDGLGAFGGGGPGGHVYEGFVETYLADHIARAGGLGLARSIEQALRSRGAAR